ncbi:pseudouridylate synthase 7 homolog [Cimex lectularius]|uniref:TRUD domain-containing protein n=1 Tax=Cimex lectularius TaxID=79782 RepID=A0A8I6S2E1_CIMLE|nr:pseudouridylate synthase 7 homolog [Cimex lectularius]
METDTTSSSQLDTDKTKGESSIKLTILQKFQQLNDDIQKEREVGQNASDKSRKNKKYTNKGKKRKHQHEDDGIYVGLMERDVGMTEFISDLKGFKGIIKHRLSDFQVHEIDLKGNVVQLTSFDTPPFEEDTGKDIPCENYKDLIKPEDMTELNKIMNDEQQISYEIDVTGMTKKERENMHKTIKYMFDNKLYSNTKSKTTDDVTKTFLVVKKCSQKPDRSSWPEHVGRYLHFTLYKENMDTTLVVNTISQNLRLRPNHITYAGIKDKRGKTSQRMCIKMRKAQELVRMKKFLRQASFGNFSYETAPLRLGDLSGNQFTLAIRNIETEDSELIKGIEHLREFGFINYFGMQRFGSSIVAPTFAIGKQLLLTNWKEAVNLILKPRYNERCSPELKICRDVWAKTQNAAAALKHLSRKESSLEVQILRALNKQGNEQYFNAFFSIPRNSMLLYLHSYQSLVWNKIVSRRIKKFGYRVLPGDLVLSSDVDEIALDQDLSESTDLNDCDDVDENEIDSNLQEVTVNATRAQKGRLEVRKLSPEEAEMTKLSEIVYPLPGKDVEFPDNETANWYTEVLAEDGLTLEHFEKSNKAFTLYGAYRKVVQIPENLTYKIVKYSSHDDDFILSDLDKMKNITLKSSQEGQYKAVLLNFNLKSSSYATMLMRELMKFDTTLSTHAKWSKELKSNKPEEKKIKFEGVEIDGKKEETEAVKIERDDKETIMTTKIETDEENGKN